MNNFRNLMRHLDQAERDARELAAAQSFGLARVRQRDANFLRRVLLGAEPWPTAAFGVEDRR